MDWGVPDWTDGNAYPRKLTVREWWWQFTRRRPDYRELWTIWAPQNEARIMRDREMHERLAADQGDTIEIFLDRAPTDDPERLRMQFGMTMLLNPRKDFPAWELSHHTYPLAGVIENERRSDTYFQVRRLVQEGEAGAAMLDKLYGIAARRDAVTVEAGLVRYVFDLSKPLNPQLQKAEKFLLAVQEERYGKQNTPKPNRQNWPNYLRVLDAVDAGIPYRQIGAVLWPKSTRRPEEQVRDNLNAARKVRDNFPF